jgi:hypothetical protein
MIERARPLLPLLPSLLIAILFAAPLAAQPPAQTPKPAAAEEKDKEKKPALEEKTSRTWSSCGKRGWGGSGLRSRPGRSLCCLR